MSQEKEQKEEETKSEMVCIRLSQKTLNKIERLAKQLGTTKSEVIRLAVYLLLMKD